MVNGFDQVVVGIPTGVSVTFADPSTKYPMPIAIDIGAEQLIANAGGCGREDQVGIAAFPVYSIAGNQNPTEPNVHPLDIVVDGPAYKQLITNWTYEHATECQTGDGFLPRRRSRRTVPCRRAPARCSSRPRRTGHRSTRCTTRDT